MEKEELLKLIKEEYYRIKPRNYVEFFEKRDTRIPSLSRLRKMFNDATYNQILRMADIDEIDLNVLRREKQEYLIKIREITERLGYIPVIQEVQKEGISHQILVKHFGSYKNLVRELEKENYEKNSKRAEVKENNEELLQMYINFSNRIGKPASVDDLNNSNEIYNGGVFLTRFGGMNGLRRLAGFEIDDRGIYNKYSKEKITNKLIEKVILKNKTLTITEINKESELPSATTVLRYYKTTNITNVYQEILTIIKERDINIYNKLLTR